MKLMFLNFGFTKFVDDMMCLRHTAHAMSGPYVGNPQGFLSLLSEAS